ncbi:glycosyltransferase family 4 protein [Actinomycetospora sp. TBRC 11914]|uniref:glycosyltransferase family 4 protein n=1 Tax=Actinomycetospora sp. TBRC 11914 TaxID=2729387 RepID=UPI00145CCA0C|nr:glycosyltransferase family 4 protein [Actinomycetospora sp. TBRC 11914]NMO90380.1 glycosyltransferase family 4 protein [Actinomycetospora sp. TBRC 11914]
MAGKLDILVLGINYAPEVTGVARYTTGVTRRLAAEGHRVQVLTGFPHYPAWSFSPGYESGWRRREEHGAVEVVRLRHPLPRNTRGPARVVMEAVFAAQARFGGMRDPDLILVMSPAILAVATALSRRGAKDAPVGAMVQDLYSRAFPETGAMYGHGGRAVARLERGLFRRADGLAVIHQRLKDTLTDLGVDGERIEVIRNWSHITPPSGALRAETRSARGWRRDEIVVLHAGNMGHKQGLENVVEAARLADEAGAPVRFVLLGDGARRPALEDLARGVARIEFLDPLPATAFTDAMAAADLCLLNEKPGLAEMCVPGKLTSYFAAGRPVLAATDPRSGGAAEITAAGAGVLVPAAEPALLLKAATAVCEDRAQYEAMSRAGLAYAEATLDEDEALGAYVDWALSLVDRRRTLVGSAR